MPFSRRFYPKRLTVMCAYILRMGGPGNRTHYPGVTSAMLYQLCYRRHLQLRPGQDKAKQFDRYNDTELHME